jgi:beta-lactamase regulating signal transducer with metallopeptidase domain
VPLNEQTVFSKMPSASVVSLSSENPDSRETKVVRWAAVLWTVGFVLILARILFSRALLLLYQRRKIEENGLAQRVLHIAEKLGVKRKIRLFESQQLSTPIAFGILRPAIALPPDFRNFNSTGQDAM